MALDTTAKHWGAMNFGMPLMTALSAPDASNLNTELERTVFLRMSPDITPSAGGVAGVGEYHPMRINIGLGV